MNKISVNPSYRLPLGLSVGLHILLIFLLFIQFPATNFRLLHPSEKTEIIQATALSQQQVANEVEKIKQAEQAKRNREVARVKALEAKAAAARRQRIQEQKRLARLKKQQEALALAQKQKLLAQKKALQAKRKQEQLRELQAKRQQERVAKLKALIAEQKALQNKILNQQLNTEKNQLNQQQAAQQSGIIDEYKAKIIAAIQGHWLVPISANKKLKSQFLIELAPGGIVVNVKLLKSSGNRALDDSARVAIYKASPLPVPKNPTLFDKFRELRLTVSPKTVSTEEVTSS